MERNERNTVGLRNFFDSLASVLIGIRNLQPVDESVLPEEEIIAQLEEASVTLRLLASENTDEDYAITLRGLQESVAQILLQLKSSREDVSASNSSFACATEHPTGVGRPRIIIQDEQIIFLRSLHFSWEKIACLLGVSESTLRRRRQQMSITSDEHFSWTNIAGSCQL